MESAPAEVSTTLPGLELEAAGELHLARPIDRSRRDTEHRVVWVQIGCGEDMTVEGVEQFQLNGEEHLFRNRRLLDDAEVLVVVAVVADLARHTRNIPEEIPAVVARLACLAFRCDLPGSVETV